MSLPFLFELPLHRRNYPGYIITVSIDDILSGDVKPLMTNDFFNQCDPRPSATSGTRPSIKSTKEKIQITLDVLPYTPEDITVKTVDEFVIIEGKHEEKRDKHAFVSRQFSRRYALPEDCDPAAVKSKLSSDGVLTIIAPKITPASKNERSVSQTSPKGQQHRQPSGESGRRKRHN